MARARTPKVNLQDCLLFCFCPKRSLSVAPKFRDLPKGDSTIPFVERHRWASFFRIRLLTFRKQWIAQLHAQLPWLVPIANNGTFVSTMSALLSRVLPIDNWHRHTHPGSPLSSQQSVFFRFRCGFGGCGIERPQQCQGGYLKHTEREIKCSQIRLASPDSNS